MTDRDYFAAAMLRERAKTAQKCSGVAAANSVAIDIARHGSVTGAVGSSVLQNQYGEYFSIHDAVPAAIAPTDASPLPDCGQVTAGMGTGNTQVPVAWAYEASDGKIIAASPSHKQIEWDVERWNGMVRDGRQAGEAKCVPLYRSPTLTDAEREAVCQAVASYEFDDYDEECVAIAATLRGLLERLK
jgi:hypothetical protein